MKLVSSAKTAFTSALLAGILGFVSIHSASAQEVTEEHLKAARAAVAASASTTALDNILPEVGERASYC